MFFMYMLKCSDLTYYVGNTDNIERRVNEHQTGFFTGYTFQRRPIKLVYVQSYATRDESLEAEARIKKWSRKKKEALVGGEWNQVAKYAKKDFWQGGIWVNPKS